MSERINKKLEIKQVKNKDNILFKKWHCFKSFPYWLEVENLNKNGEWVHEKNSDFENNWKDFYFDDKKEIYKILKELDSKPSKYDLKNAC